MAGAEKWTLSVLERQKPARRRQSSVGKTMRNLLLGLALIALAACGKADGSDTGGVLFPLLASALAVPLRLADRQGRLRQNHWGIRYMRGIAGQKQVEKALRESEAKFRRYRGHG